MSSARRRAADPPPTEPRALDPRALLDPRAPFLVPLILLLAARAFLAWAVPIAGEDAHITFRYAWNWVHGAGPVYNPGEHVLGVTSPPWMAWIALGLRLGADPLVWTRATLMVTDAIALLAFTALLDRHASRASAWCFAVFFAAWPYFSGLLCSGMETGAMVALIGATAWLVDRRRVSAGVVLGVLAVFRPEGLLAALVLAIWATPRARWTALAIAVGVAGALGLYYGSPVPQSLTGKVAAYGIAGLPGSSPWWAWAVPVPLPFLTWTGEGSNLFPLALILSPAAVAGAIALWKLRRTALAGAVVALGLIWLLLLGSGATFFFWYLAAPIAAWALLASVGLPRIAGHPLVYGSLVLAVLGHWLYEGNLYSGRARSESQLFGGVAELLHAQAAPGATVVLEPIGVIGWRCRDLRLVDDVGLVSPAASAHRRRGPGWYADLLAETRPDWLVVRAGLLDGTSAFAGPAAPFRDLDEGQRTLADFQLASAGDSTAGEQALLVFQRRDGR